LKNPPAILGKIAKSTLVRVENAKKTLSFEQVREQAVALAENEYGKKNRLPLRAQLPPQDFHLSVR